MQVRDTAVPFADPLPWLKFFRSTVRHREHPHSPQTVVKRLLEGTRRVALFTRLAPFGLTPSITDRVDFFRAWGDCCGVRKNFWNR